MNLSSGENATVKTGASLSFNSATALPSLADQILTVLSSPAETNHFPSAENSAQWTGPAWPDSVCKSFQSGADQTRTFPSSHAVATRDESREKAMLSTVASCPLSASVNWWSESRAT